MGIQHQRLDIMIAKQGFSPGQQYEIVGSEQFFHVISRQIRFTADAKGPISRAGKVVSRIISVA